MVISKRRHRRHAREVWHYPYDVRGWLSEREAELLVELSRDRAVLEIGSFCGKSTIVMGQVARKVHAVDWHRGGDGLGENSNWTLPELTDNLDQWGVMDQVIVHVGRSEEVCQSFRDDYFGMAFVDGAHDYKSVCRDAASAKRCVYDGGFVAFHDFNEEGVKQAIVDVFGNTDGNVLKDDSGRHTFYRTI